MSGEGSAVALVYVLFGSADAARLAARTVVEERLAACANILPPCLSIFEWDGAVNEAQETPVLFKTGTSVQGALIARLGELHDYEVPAIVAWTGDAAPPFARWVADQSRQAVK